MSQINHRLHEYNTWISENYPTAEKARNQCSVATNDMVAKFPELKRVRGYYGIAEHWWCVTDTGVIVDPTRHQFIDDCEYEPLDESLPHPTGKCPNCGDYCYNNSYCCSQNCEVAYVAYCTNPYS